MPSSPNDAKVLFLQVLEMGPAERAAHLDRACAGDPALRQRVEALLGASERPDSILDHPIVAMSASAASAPTAHFAGRADGGPTPLPQAASPAEHDLGFLAPPGEPGSLGRLDHYEILEALGQGATGLVLKARDTRLQRLVAVKVLAPELAVSGTARQRFAREARAAAAVRDEHVVAVYAVHDDGPIPYLIMELLGGATLEARLRAAGPLPVKEVLRIGLQAARGLAAAHAQGLVHRDIKPGNILLEDGQQRVKLGDFGLARLVDDASLTQSGVIAGTPLYMSPEQARGEPVDGRSDLFSLGSVLYTLCAGRPAFRADSAVAVLRRVCRDTPRSLREVNADIPEWLETVIARLMAKEPAERFQSAAEVADVLTDYLAQLHQFGEVRSRRLAPPTAVAPPGRARRRWAVAALVLLGLGAFAGYRLMRPEGPPAARPSPLDGRRREEVPLALLALAGGGDPALAPAELVAVLGDAGRFRLPNPGLSHFPARTADGSLLAVPCGNDLALFRARSGELLRVFRGLTARATIPAFSRDGRWLACGAADGVVLVWEVATGAEQVILRGHQGYVGSVAFSPDGQRLASGGWSDFQVKVWDWRAGKEAVPLEGHRNGVPLLCYSPDGKILISGAIDKAVLVRDAVTGRTLHKLLGHTRTVYGLAFSPDGKWLATGSDGEWKLWRADTFTEVRSVDAQAGWLDFTPDGKTLLTARREVYPEGAAHRFQRWDVQTGAPQGEAALRSIGGHPSYLLSADGKTLFSMRMQPPEPFLHCYDALTGKEDMAEPGGTGGHTGAVASVAFSPDRRWLASGGADRTVRLWDLTTCQAARTLARHTDKVESVAFSPDGARLASGSADGTIVLWDVARGAEVRVLGGQAGVSQLAFRPDGKALAAGGADGTVRLWDVADGRPGEPRPGHQDGVRAVAFSPDGRWLASAGADRTVRVCVAATGERLHSFGAPAAVLTLAFSPDGKRLAAGTGAPDAAVHLWDLETGRKASLPADGDVTGLAFHPSGGLVAVGARSGRVWLRVAGPADGPTLTFGPGLFGAEVGGLAFAPGGRYLAVAQGNGLISVLRVPPPPKDYRPAPRSAPEPAKLAARPSAADALKRADLPADAPPELVAVLGEQARFRLTHGGACHGMAVSKGGEYLAVPCGKALLIFDVRTGRLLHALPEHQDRALEAAFSPDGKRVACGSFSSAVRVWDVKSGRLERTLTGPKRLTHGVAFSPDGKRVAAASWDSDVWLWDTDTGENPRALKGHSKTVFCVHFSPDGKWLASGGMDGEARVWEAATGKELHVLKGHTDEVRCVAFSPDGKWLATGSDKEALLWDTSAFKEPRTLATAAGWLAFTPDSKDLLTGPLFKPLGKAVRRWDTTTGERRGQFFLPVASDWAVYALSPDGKTLFATPWWGGAYVRVYDAATGRERRPQAADAGRPLGCVAVSPDGRLLAAGSSGATRTTVGIFDLTTGRLKARWPGHGNFVRAVPFSPDGKLLASAGEDGWVRLREVETGKERLAFRAHAGPAYSLAFSPDGTLLASGGPDRTARLWDVRSGRLLRVFTGHDETVEGVAFSPDGKLLATAGWDRTVRLWDVAGGWQLAMMTGHTDRVRCVAFHPGGRLLASGAVDSTVRLWDVTTRRLKQILDGHTREVVKLAWRGDGRVLASCGGEDGTVRLWDVGQGGRHVRVLPLLPPGSDWVHGVAVTPEGRHLVTANPDGTAWVLRLAGPGAVFRVAEGKRGDGK